MGSYFTKDKAIDLYVQINQNYFYPGDTVTGNVYLHAKTQRPYTTLQIAISGQQYVYWKTGSGTNYHSYRNIEQTYETSFTLHQFQGTVHTGHYQFPFTFVLPSSITGSYTHSNQCYIQYACAARLNHQNYQQKQIYAVLLNILQPIRAQKNPIAAQETVLSQCWKCASYGKTVSTLRVNKNYAIAGQQIEIQFQINNSQGKQGIKNGKITLEQRRLMISHSGKVDYNIQYQQILHAINRTIAPGQKYVSHFKSKIPNTLVQSSIIGNLTAICYFIHLQTKYGCCSNIAQCQIHIMVHCKQPQLMKPDDFKLPQNWNPKRFPPTKCHALQPYIYKPLQKIPSRHLPQNKEQLVYPQPKFLREISPTFRIYKQPYWNSGTGSLKPGYLPTFPSQITEMHITSFSTDH